MEPMPEFRVGFILACAACCAAAQAARPPAPPPSYPRLFISPSGEPFRGKGDEDQMLRWFRQADADHDGKLTRAEYMAEFMAYFDVLDQNKDGELGPDDIGVYEHKILPEVQMSAAAYNDAYNENYDNDGNPIPAPEQPGGAAFFSFFGAPEPLLVMDTNFNRGVSRLEYSAAAVRSWRLLNPNGKPWLLLSDLPKTRAQPGGN